MSKEELVPVNLWLAGRSYRILIPQADEQRITEAVKKADEKIAELKQTYAGKDDQDFIAMCLLLYASEQDNQSGNLAETIRQMSMQIDQALE